MSYAQSMIEEVKNAVTDAEVPLGQKEPGAPFIVVSLSYLAVLTICLLLISLAIYLL